MKSLVILGKNMDLETRAVHVAPGGSVIYVLEAEATVLSTCLAGLREEMAYGMIDAKDLDLENKVVSASIYMGLADVKDFMAYMAGTSDSQDISIIRKREIAETESLDGLSMSARNQVIDALI